MAKIKSIIYIPGKYNLQTRTVTFFRSGNIAKKSRIYFANDVSINFLFLILIFFFPCFFFLVNFIAIRLQLMNFIITHQLHHNLSYLICFSFGPSDNFHLFPSFYAVNASYHDKAKFTLWKTLIMFIA